MTRAEIRLAAAKKREAAAMAAVRGAYEARDAAVDKVCRKHEARILRAVRERREAWRARAVAELAVIGIEPMATIIQWRGCRFVVRVTTEGWRRLVPVGKRGAILKSRVDIDPPFVWSAVTVTGDVMKKDAA